MLHLPTLRLFGFAAFVGAALAFLLSLTAAQASEGPIKAGQASTASSIADRLLGAPPAPGRITLRPTVSVDTPLVRLSDLATGTLRDADTALFRAPKPGTTGTVAIGRIIEAVRRLGYEQISTGGITRVTVTRTGRSISRDDIARAIADHLIFLGHAQQGALIDVRLDPGVSGFFVERSASGPIKILKLDANPAARRFSAMVTVDGSQMAASGVGVTGFAEELIEVPTLARPVNRGETISPSDVLMTPIPLSRLGQDTMMAVSDVAGMAARRSLRDGRPLGKSDLMRPILVKKDDLIAIVYSRAGMTLTVRGRAVSQGAEGDTITVLNLQSNRMLRAVVRPDGTVAITPSGGKLAALNAQ